jgi:hypothetical protein
MAKALQRILRIRQLAEEQARLEVERAAQRARQASAACAKQATLEHEQRTTLAASWIHGLQQPEGNASLASAPDPRSEVAEEHGWLMEEAVLEFFGWRRMRLEELRLAELRRMEPLVEEYTERRRELRQTEQLIEQRTRIEAMEKNRRAQADTDEWFSQRTLMQQRRELRRTVAARPEVRSDQASFLQKESALRQF